MTGLRKKMVVGVSLFIMQGACGMEQQIQSMQQGSLKTLTSAAITGWGLVTTGFTKATTTAINAYSDDAAFAKLGFPPTNDVNKAELLKFKAVSDRHSQAIFSVDMVDAEQFGLDDQFINRRFEFLKRAINAMPTRVDGVELAGFCLENYEKVMNSFMISRMVTFVHNKKESSEQISQKLNHLAEATDSALFRSVSKSSGIKRTSIEEEQVGNKEEENQEQQ